MFSNRINSSFGFYLRLAFATLLCVLLSCTPKIGEKPPDQTNQEFSGTQCLTEAMPVVKRFAAGDANEVELSQAWDCVRTAFEKFKKYVRGRQSTRYEAMELATFLESNFFDSNPSGEKRIKPELVDEFMQIKVIFVGGSDQFLTMSELNSTISLIEEFRAVTLRVNPYMKVYLQTWTGSDSPVRDQRFFESADLALQDVSKRLGDLILRNNTTYRLDRVPVLLRELAKLYREEWEMVASVEKYLPLVKKVKKAIAGGDEAVVGSDEWRRFLLLGVRGYSQYLRYFYFIENANGSAGGRRLGYLARSIEDAFSIFHDLVSEKPGGVVTRQETAEILLAFSNAYPTFKFSEKLLDELMTLKTSFFGGSDQNWDVRDFEQAKLKVPKLKSILETIWPYYALLAQDWDWTFYSFTEARQIFAESDAALSSAAQELGDLVEGPYDLNRVQSFLDELERLYPPKDPKNSLSASLKKYLPLIIKGKQIIYQDNDSIIRREYWGSAFAIAAKAYHRYLDYYFFVQDKPIEDALVVQSIIENTRASSDFAKYILLKKANHVLSVDEIVSLLILARNQEILPKEIRDQTLLSAVKAIVGRVLVEPKKRIENNFQPTSINNDSIDLMIGELRQFLKLRLEMSSMFMKPGASVEMADRLTPADFVAEVQKRILISSDAELKLALSEYLRVLDSPVPMVLDSQTRLQISNLQNPTYDIKSANSMALNVMLARVIMRSFAGEMSRIETYKGITEAELKALFEIAKPFFVDLKLIDQSNNTFAESRFREANIFTPHGNGDLLGSFEEIADEATMIFSGLKLNSLLFESLKLDCLPPAKDYPINMTVSFSCLKKSYRKAMPEALSSMPEYQKYMKAVSPAEWEIYFLNALKSAGYIPNDKQAVMLGDLSLLPHVIQYLEMTMARFDKNKDAILSTRDAMRAYPSFKGILEKLAEEDIKKGTIDAKDLPALFAFIMRYAHPPQSIGEKLKWFLSWKRDPNSWDVWADRSQLAKILGYIADELAKAAKAAKAGVARTPIIPPDQTPLTGEAPADSKSP